VRKEDTYSVGPLRKSSITYSVLYYLELRTMEKVKKKKKQKKKHSNTITKSQLLNDSVILCTSFKALQFPQYKADLLPVNQIMFEVYLLYTSVTD
jgi:hypothetical protein